MNSASQHCGGRCCWQSVSNGNYPGRRRTRQLQVSDQVWCYRCCSSAGWW